MNLNTNFEITDTAQRLIKQLYLEEKLDEVPVIRLTVKKEDLGLTYALESIEPEDIQDTDIRKAFLQVDVVINAGLLNNFKDVILDLRDGKFFFYTHKIND